MKAAFKPDTLVQTKANPKVIGRISNRLKEYGWRIPGYLGEGFYEVVVDGVALTAREDEIEVCVLTREEIATRLETLAQEARDGGWTTNAMLEAEYAINVLRHLENFMGVRI